MDPLPRQQQQQHYQQLLMPPDPLTDFRPSMAATFTVDDVHNLVAVMHNKVTPAGCQTWFNCCPVGSGQHMGDAGFRTTWLHSCH
jgi:hypothetical protein